MSESCSGIQSMSKNGHNLQGATGLAVVPSARPSDLRAKGWNGAEVQRLRLLNAGEVSQITGLSTETLAQWRSQQKGIPFVRLSRNRIGYRAADLDAFLEACIVPVRTESKSAKREN